MLSAAVASAPKTGVAARKAPSAPYTSPDLSMETAVIVSTSRGERGEDCNAYRGTSILAIGCTARVVSESHFLGICSHFLSQGHMNSNRNSFPGGLAYLFGTALLWAVPLSAEVIWRGDFETGTTE